MKEILDSRKGDLEILQELSNDQIIKSILDSDLYKFTQQWFVIQKYPDVDVEYTFSNRDASMTFNKEALEEIKNQVNKMAKLKLTDQEHDWMKENLLYLPITFRQYLSAYRFNPNQVDIELDENNNLKISIKGKWRDTILWEVPLMAIISEVYFSKIDKDWDSRTIEYDADQKAKILSNNNCKFADFGTRRRRSFYTQDLVVKTMKNSSGFVGTSNPYLAMKYNVKSLGTCAHESIGAVAALESLNHPNKVFMERWAEVYKGDLGTMLPDTYGLDSFLKDFTLEKAKLWDGVRHDSGDPFLFTDKIIEHYEKLKIDPTTKTIIFSDGLDVETAINISNYCNGKIRYSFGIGTYFTSNFVKLSNKSVKSKPMNMVIKLTKVDGIPVVKLSDSIGKEIGDENMIRIMKYIHKNKLTL